jgi:hypothetical protein
LQQCTRGAPLTDYIILKSWEWLIINFVVNAVGVALLDFYIFKGSTMQEEYIKLCTPGTCMALQKKNLDDYLPLQVVAYFFLQIYSKGDFSREHTSLDPL